MLESWLIAWWVLFLGLSWYPCPDCCGDETGDACNKCVDGDTYADMTLVVSGVVDGSCSGCESEYNGTFVAPQIASCTWKLFWDGHVCYSGDRVSAQVAATGAGTSYQYEGFCAVANSYPSYGKSWRFLGSVQATTLDCLNADGTGESLLSFDTGDTGCDFSSATMEVYSGDTT